MAPLLKLSLFVYSSTPPEGQKIGQYDVLTKNVGGQGQQQSAKATPCGNHFNQSVL
jgi:hypothetical protein